MTEISKIQSIELSYSSSLSTPSLYYIYLNIKYDQDDYEYTIKLGGATIDYYNIIDKINSRIYTKDFAIGIPAGYVLTPTGYMTEISSFTKSYLSYGYENDSIYHTNFYDMFKPALSNFICLLIKEFKYGKVINVILWTFRNLDKAVYSYLPIEIIELIIKFCGFPIHFEQPKST
jgi:hypothetical protein